MNFAAAFKNTLPSDIYQNTEMETIQDRLRRYVVGENGSLSLASTVPIESSNDEMLKGLLVQYMQLMRGDSVDTIQNRINAILELAIASNNIVSLQQLCLVTLFIRNPRKGKGEKVLSYHAILHLWNRLPQVVEFLLPLLGSKFGYWKDMCHLFDLSASETQRNTIIKVFVDQLKADEILMNAGERNLSLAGKWAPREGSLHKKMAKAMAKTLFPHINSQTSNKYLWKSYRQLLSRFNSIIDPVEVKMCRKEFKEIVPSAVSSNAVGRYRKALQNLKADPRPKDKRTRTRTVMSGLRHDIDSIDYEDRNACSENFATHIAAGGKINSVTAELYQLIESYMAHGAVEDAIVEAQWTARISDIRKMIADLKEEATNKGEVYNTPSIFPMIDLSGSMNGKPMQVAIMLGLFCAEFQESEYGNMFMTFASNPVNVSLPQTKIVNGQTVNTSLFDKVRHTVIYTSDGHWGYSTNITAAFTSMLSLAISNRISPDKMPRVLAIFSDMQFDQGDSSYRESSTSYQRMKMQFTNAGYQIPHVLFWNLRDGLPGYQVDANAPDTSMVSGFSTRMMDLFLTSNLSEMAPSASSSSMDEDVAEDVTSITLLNKILEHEMFDEEFREKLLESITRDLSNIRR
jgi:hypothetical protein